MGRASTSRRRCAIDSSNLRNTDGTFFISFVNFVSIELQDLEVGHGGHGGRAGLTVHERQLADHVPGTEPGKALPVASDLGAAGGDYEGEVTRSAFA